MAIGNDPTLHNKRELSRVETHIPLEIRLVSPEERQYIRSRIEGKRTIPIKLPKDVDDPLLAEWLNLLNAKLDVIMKVITAGEESIVTPQYIAENISGGGISFISDREFILGDVLEVKIAFSPMMSQILFLYGEVVHSETRAEGSFTAISFILLDDAIRDEIIRFVFEKEREILREKRGE